MSSKVYIGLITENYENYENYNEIQNFHTKAYTKSLQNLKECLYEALQICINQNDIDYKSYVEGNDLDCDEFSENDFIEKMKFTLDNISDEKLCIQEFENICIRYGNSYYNDKWVFNLLECNLH
jgi:hypothetical protein